MLGEEASELRGGAAHGVARRDLPVTGGEAVDVCG